MGLTRQAVLRRFVFVEYSQWSSGSTAALRVRGLGLVVCGNRSEGGPMLAAMELQQ